MGIALGVLLLELPHFRRPKSLAGAVLSANSDPRKQVPLANVEISATLGGAVAKARSDASGYFRLNWSARVWEGEQVTLRFRNPAYQPLEITKPFDDQLYVAHLKPVDLPKRAEAHGPDVPVSDIRVRYYVKATSTVNIGSMARTFQVINAANIPCGGRPPCSPDGKWKAAIGGISLDAGDGQEFQNVRLSCIAGPCPFTRIESDRFSMGGSKISASVRAWCDTVTFLVEAEVVHTMLSDAIRQAYPSIFGRRMTFTLPPTGQGPSIEAEVNGLDIVFPLGPDLSLSWASCSNVKTAANRNQLYRCELKAGYQFR